ncbi:NAD(P)H-binding protein [Streptomonospora sp. S1-112]|uniref:NAD(P)H-binding protein n=1 Tax=Streptomonospora mangrovi TaxID=2883123 RepID=A0A9X3NTD9_9ACTN|nr:NAD(P)H-binding protein [Streptomonospora mangrovi]MDA0568038.1 NAD(P)H-binding protein [Streptomonospora mangrovi]
METTGGGVAGEAAGAVPGMRIAVFGAGGRAGREVVAEARRRGHRVTAAVRDPAAHAGLAGEGVALVAADAADAAAVAAVAADHDAVVSTAAAYGPGTDPHAFFTHSARALLEAARRSRSGRLIVVGLGGLLTDASGRPLVDALGVPEEFRPFCDGHAAGLAELRAGGADVDWLYLSPAGDFDHGGDRRGGYRVVEHGEVEARISYPDFAVAVLDETERPRHRRVHLAVTW